MFMRYIGLGIGHKHQELEVDIGDDEILVEESEEPISSTRERGDEEGSDNELGEDDDVEEDLDADSDNDDDLGYNNL